MSGLNREFKHKDFFKEIDPLLLLKILDKKQFDKEEDLYKAVQKADTELTIEKYEELTKKKKDSLSHIFRYKIIMLCDSVLLFFY